MKSDRTGMKNCADYVPTVKGECLHEEKGHCCENLVPCSYTKSENLFKKGDFVGMIYAQPGNDTTQLLVLEDEKPGEDVLCLDCWFNIELRVPHSRVWVLNERELVSTVSHYKYGNLTVKERLNQLKIEKFGAFKSNSFSLRQQELAEWQERNFPKSLYDHMDRDALISRIRILELSVGMAEEVGELSHVILKASQKIRDGVSGEIDKDLVADGFSDTVIYGIQLMTRLGIDSEDVLRKTINTVLARNWIMDRKDGHGSIYVR